MFPIRFYPLACQLLGCNTAYFDDSSEDFDLTLLVPGPIPSVGPVPPIEESGEEDFAPDVFAFWRQL